MAARHRTRQHRALQQALHAMRSEKGLTQLELASRLGKPQSYVSKYESGERKLELPELEAICSELGAGLEALVRRYKRELAGR
jgi:transcriptional regulator with XRE-family HTH domain